MVGMLDEWNSRCGYGLVMKDIFLMKTMLKNDKDAFTNAIQETRKQLERGTGLEGRRNIDRSIRNQKAIRDAMKEQEVKEEEEREEEESWEECDTQTTTVPINDQIRTSRWGGDWKEEEEEQQVDPVAEERLVSSVRTSLENAGFELLSKRDIDLCESLNAGYLLRLSILPDVSELDEIAQEFYPERFDADGKSLDEN